MPAAIMGMDRDTFMLAVALHYCDFLEAVEDRQAVPAKKECIEVDPEKPGYYVTIRGERVWCTDWETAKDAKEREKTRVIHTCPYRGVRTVTYKQSPFCCKRHSMSYSAEPF